MNELALFAGAGGGILASELLGIRTVCAVEVDDYARSVLLARQNDGILRPFPIWDDVRTFDGRPWRGTVDLVSGGFPCQDISIAGTGRGLDGARSGLWRHMARIVGEIGPQFVFVENSPMLARRGLRTVVGDLAALGYGCRWGVLSAAALGAPHKRDRLWLLADAACSGRQEVSQRFVSAGGTAGPAENPQEARQRPRVAHSDADSERLEDSQRAWPAPEPAERPGARDRPGWWTAEPALGRVANGVADRVDQLRTLGNGQVPAVAARAFRLLLAAARG